jgi:hypothetical protein
MKRQITLLLLAVCVGGACLTDWENGVPCRTDHHCIDGYTCQPDGGCGQGTRVSDAGPKDGGL